MTDPFREFLNSLNVNTDNFDQPDTQETPAPPVEEKSEEDKSIPELLSELAYILELASAARAFMDMNDQDIDDFIADLTPEEQEQKRQEYLSKEKDCSGCPCERICKRIAEKS